MGTGKKWGWPSESLRVMRPADYTGFESTESTSRDITTESQAADNERQQALLRNQALRTAGIHPPVEWGPDLARDAQSTRQTVESQPTSRSI